MRPHCEQARKIVQVDKCVCVDLIETIDGMKCQKCGKMYSEANPEVLGSDDASVLTELDSD